MKLIFIIFVLFGFFSPVPVRAAEYAVARTYAPILNAPDFKNIFGGEAGLNLKTDRCGQVRELEFIALPGTVFTLLEKERFGTLDIYRVATDEYTAPPNVRFYVDGRFLRMVPSEPPPRRASLPKRGLIVSALRAAVGKPYVWGGNVLGGVPELAAWYYAGISTVETERHLLAGLDCSGLLYHATGGWTPRNTSQLTSFGSGIEIAGKHAAEIASLLQPLDLIVWNGHVIIVLDQKTAIESRLECGKPGHGGVVITRMQQRLAEVMRTRRPANTWQNSAATNRNSFVVRRWYVQP